MDNQETIKILIDKTEVLGRITHRSKSDIGVEIINPYQNISSSLHIGYFARAHRSFADDYGDQAPGISLRNSLRSVNT